MLEDCKIRAFLALSEESSFTQAARRLGISQPAVSAQIAALEKLIGQPLFVRGPKLHLTPSGDAFLAYARRIQKAYDLANEAFFPPKTI